jgi:DNA polymerase (family 10)
MTEKPRFPFAAAMLVAEELCTALKPHCERMAIAGSLRRQKPTVGDIELLFVAKMGVRKADLLSIEEYSVADFHIGEWLRVGILAKRPNKVGVFTWGPLNKLAVHVSSGIPVDLFAEPKPEEWFRSLVIRTGPKELNKRLIESAHRNGVQVHAYGNPALVRLSTGKPLECHSERDFFALCGVPYAEPWERI